MYNSLFHRLAFSPNPYTGTVREVPITVKTSEYGKLPPDGSYCREKGPNETTQRVRLQRQGKTGTKIL